MAPARYGSRKKTDVKSEMSETHGRNENCDFDVPRLINQHLDSRLKPMADSAVDHCMFLGHCSLHPTMKDRRER